ncbi:hypothetical protein [Natronococcus jeotgali]|uniref:Uncharacterized protein n=1 Tax=Natronococcus jeotgali DSM 18795 TaxID=1227498 RepID=L9XAE3_9EURY|nr:hypothetical protein [Natronococcus jeotgali]ELY58724.1 hypothetical protein C492_11565 [Natronococcus jeotgali DSM 18795]
MQSATHDDPDGVHENEEVTALPRAFVVEASGPATIVRDCGGVTERTEGEISITHQIETLEEFGEFWNLRNKRFPKQDAINKLVGELEDGDVCYEEEPDEWDVLIDGHVQAFYGLAKTIVEFDGDPDLFDAPNQRYWDRVANNIGHDVDELVQDFAKDLKSSKLWGPGARLAELTVKHANRDDLVAHTEALFEEVEG